MINVILVDDHQIFIDGLQALFDTVENIAVIGSANNGKQLLDLMEKIQPHVIILDIHMPEMDGLATIKIVKKKYPKVKVLILTYTNRGEHVLKMTQNKADGYLLKDGDKAELINAIYAVHQGKRYLPLGIQNILIDQVQKEPTEEVVFTKREVEVLQLVVRGSTNKMIAEQLGVAETTVITHIRNMFKKSDTKNRIQLLEFARNKEWI